MNKRQEEKSAVANKEQRRCVIRICVDGCFQRNQLCLKAFAKKDRTHGDPSRPFLFFVSPSPLYLSQIDAR